MVKRIYYDQDAEYFRRLEAERIEQTGPDLEYYSLNRGINVDPLYNEPDSDPLYGGSQPFGSSQDSKKSWNFYPDVLGGDDALIMSCSILYQQMDGRVPSVTPEGKKVEYDAQVFIARNHWECAVNGTVISNRIPKEDDVIYVAGEWWDVIKANKGGNILDSQNNVGFALDIKKRTEFTPDRKVDL